MDGLKMEKYFVAHYNQEEKKIQTVEEHLQNTSKICGYITAKIGCKNLGMAVGLLHDLGKYSIAFNHYIQSRTGLIDNSDKEDYFNGNSTAKMDHASAGAIIIRKLLKDKLFASFIGSFVIKCHHGGLRDVLMADGETEIERLMRKEDSETRLRESFENFESNDNLMSLLGEVDIAKAEFELNVIRDKLFNENVNNKNKAMMAYFKLGLLVKYIYSALIDADRIDTADFQESIRQQLKKNKQRVTWEKVELAFEAYMKKFSFESPIDKIRKEISDACYFSSEGNKGIYKLQVPTGGGKTLASMRFALNHARRHEMDHIIIVIPYTSIIDQNADVYRNIFEKKLNGRWTSDFVLEHHGNLTDDEKNDLSRMLSENWDVPIVITTMVQFLESVFSGGTSGIRRMHNMANSVIIFDEIQLLPPKTMVMFNGLIEFLKDVCGSTIVLSTATQPLLNSLPDQHKDYSIEIPEKNNIIINPNGLYRQLKRVHVEDLTRNSGWTEEEILELILECNQSYGSSLVIVNTKKAATDLYNLLQYRVSAEVFHLSTNMCPAHRRKKLAKMNYMLASDEDRRKVICISTQLIEAGIDVDFDVGIRYLAGMDSVVQAAGRINRHAKRENGKLFVVNANEKGVDNLKHIKCGREASIRLLDTYKRSPEQFDCDLMSIEAMNTYYRFYYHFIKADMQYSLQTKSAVNTPLRLFDILGYNTWHRNINKRMGMPYQMNFAMAFKTAGDAFSVIEGIQIGVIVPFDEGRDYINELLAPITWERFFFIKNQLQQYTVNMYRDNVPELTTEGKIHAVNIRIVNGQTDDTATLYYLNDNYYSDEIGCLQASRINAIIID